MFRARILLLSLLLASGVAFGNEEKPKSPEAPKEATAEIGKWEGFRGIKWGTERSKIDGMGDKPALSENGYTRKGDSLKVGDVKLVGVFWMFHHDKLAAVFITTQGEDNKNKLLEILNARYGKPTLNEPFPEIIIWTEHPLAKEGGYVRMEYESFEEIAVVSFADAEIMSRMKEEEENKAKKAGDDDL